MTKFQVEVNRTCVYEVEADSKEAAVDKVDNKNLTPIYNEFQYATATEVPDRSKPTTYQVSVSRTHVYEVKADNQEDAEELAFSKDAVLVDDFIIDIHSNVIDTEPVGPTYEFSTTDEKLVATYPVGLPDSDEEGSIQFHLTPEGLIVDVFDHNGEVIDVFARTAQEFADYRLVQP